jgi:hypothetical protein
MAKGFPDPVIRFRIRERSGLKIPTQKERQPYQDMHRNASSAPAIPGHASQREFRTHEGEFERQMMRFFITNIRKRKYA